MLLRVLATSYKERQSVAHLQRYVYGLALLQLLLYDNYNRYKFSVMSALKYYQHYLLNRKSEFRTPYDIVLDIYNVKHCDIFLHSLSCSSS